MTQSLHPGTFTYELNSNVDERSVKDLYLLHLYLLRSSHSDRPLPSLLLLYSLANENVEERARLSSALLSLSPSTSISSFMRRVVGSERGSHLPPPLKRIRYSDPSTDDISESVKRFLVWVLLCFFSVLPQAVAPFPSADFTSFAYSLRNPLSSHPLRPRDSGGCILFHSRSLHLYLQP